MMRIWCLGLISIVIFIATIITIIWNIKKKSFKINESIIIPYIIYNGSYKLNRHFLFMWNLNLKSSYNFYYHKYIRVACLIILKLIWNQREEEINNFLSLYKSKMEKIGTSAPFEQKNYPLSVLYHIMQNSNFFFYYQIHNSSI